MCGSSKLQEAHTPAGCYQLCPFKLPPEVHQLLPGQLFLKGRKQYKLLFLQVRLSILRNR